MINLINLAVAPHQIFHNNSYYQINILPSTYVFRDILKFKMKYLSQQHWLISLVFVIDTWFINCEAS
jgi:hypothetical protein